MAIGATLLVALGTTGAVVAALGLARGAAEYAGGRFPVVDGDRFHLKLTIQHEQDLVVSAVGFVVGNPNATEKDFVRSADGERAQTLSRAVRIR